MKKQKCIFYILLIAALWGLNSCGSSKPIQKYLLLPTAEYENSSSETIDNSAITIAVGVIEFPEYLKSPQIVSFKNSNELFRDEYNRWASPLKENFEKVLINDVSTYIPTNKISFYGSEMNEKNVYRINAIVSEFGLQADSSIILDARWGTTSEGISFTLDKRSSFSENGKGAGYNEQAKIMSMLTAKLAKEIADEIKLKFKAGK
ncbi:MAG: membrane integrity-associated transporter subunit PqiC [Chlorobi bacterium]|nr:membrane integrity-associated transporter subunit PqiC [Chlorobiota bacterium]